MILASKLSKVLAAAAAVTACLAGTAGAQEPTPPMAPAAPAASTSVAATAPTPPPPPAPPPPPYSLPWQLRPLAAATVLRSDTSMAFYENAAGQSGSTVATMLLGSYKLTPTLAPLVRLGFVQNGAPGATPDGTSFVNPILGITYARRFGSFRAAGFAGGTIPVGAGGGDTPDPGSAAANGAGRDARSGMDNAMFAVNYFTAILGAGAGYVDHKLTVQVEATVFQLFRTRGENAAASTDDTRTNSTSGIHVGYFVAAPLSLGAELRYQRWLSTPTRLVMGNKVDITDAAMDTLSVAFGPRAHFKIGDGMWLRPGIAYVRALDNPLADSSYNMVQVDVPVIF